MPCFRDAVRTLVSLLVLPLSCLLFSFISDGAQQQPVVFHSGVMLYVCVCVCARALKSECECVGELGAAVSGNSLRRRSVSFSQTHTHIKKEPTSPRACMYFSAHTRTGSIPVITVP